jgi:hypothetical protein
MYLSQDVLVLTRALLVENPLFQLSTDFALATNLSSFDLCLPDFMFPHIFFTKNQSKFIFQLILFRSHALHTFSRIDIPSGTT